MFARDRRRDRSLSRQVSGLLCLLMTGASCVQAESQSDTSAPSAGIERLASSEAAAHQVETQRTFDQLAVFVLSTKECASCRGTGLAIRSAAATQGLEVLVLYDAGHKADFDEMFVAEKIRVPRRAVSPGSISKALNSDVGGAIVLIRSDSIISRRVGPQDDWSTEANIILGARNSARPADRQGHGA